MDDEIKPKKDWFFAKFALMVIFVTLDVYLNSKAEYEALVTKSSLDELSQLQMLLFGSGILLQISLASAFFLILCNTFPFQVGLLAPIFQVGTLKWLLVLQPVYFVLTCIVGGMRLNQVFNGNAAGV